VSEFLQVELRPVTLRDVSKEEIVDAIAAACGPVESFVGVNAHTVYLAERDANFREVLEGTWRYCDGFGVHLLAALQGLPKPKHRNTPTDFMWDVFARLHSLGRTVYLLGDEPGVAERFAQMLNERHPGLVIGHRNGFFEVNSAEEREIVAGICALRPHLLCLGMGQPRQEKWAHRLRGELGCAAVLNLGASMAFAIGARKRGPAWATGRGLEWLFRVLAEPRKMFSRYFVEIPWLVIRALRSR
jgi:N-acetylglucosaminyldiphosphoundecaprenol N-acetyl-beta-D-mannosaminyltransferase